jgi:hypothetical protein
MVRFHVSEQGNDGRDGRSPDTAFGSLTRARDAVREARRAAEFDGAEVVVAAGAYRMTEGLSLTAADSGTNDHPVVWRGEGLPAFSGAVTLRGFQPVSDPGVLERIPEAARAHVLECDLTANGVTDFGTFRDRGAGRVNPSHMELYYRGKRQTLARWPNDGFTRVAGLVEEHTNTYEEHGHEQKGSHTHFRFAEDRPKQWKQLDDVLLHGYWSWDWADRYIRPVAWDMERKIVEVVSQKDSYDIRENRRFRYLNILEELDMPGEWYADRRTGRLYFWPPDDFVEGEAEVSMLETPFLSLEGVSHVTLRGLSFRCARATAVAMNECTDITMEGCAFTSLGSQGVMAKQVLRTRIDSCSFSQMGDGGIWMSGGDRKTLEPSGNRITNCDIHHFGEWSRCYCLGISIHGVAIVASHNSIHDAPQEALQYTGNDHVIEYNDFYRLCQDTDDAGATHTGRDWTQRGTVLRYNYIHDVSSYSGSVGVIGIYLDDWASAHVLYGNIFEGVHIGVMIGSGRDNVLKKNIFVGCSQAIHFDARGLGWAKYYFDGRTNTLFDHLANTDYEDLPYLQRYPQLLYLLDDEPVLPKYNVILENQAWGCGQWMRYHNDMSDRDILVMKKNDVRAEAPEGWKERADLYPALEAGSSLDSSRWNKI